MPVTEKSRISEQAYQRCCAERRRMAAASEEAEKAKENKRGRQSAAQEGRGGSEAPASLGAQGNEGAAAQRQRVCSVPPSRAPAVRALANASVRRQRPRQSPRSAAHGMQRAPCAEGRDTQCRGRRRRRGEECRQPDCEHVCNMVSVSRAWRARRTGVQRSVQAYSGRKCKQRGSVRAVARCAVNRSRRVPAGG